MAEFNASQITATPKTFSAGDITAKKDEPSALSKAGSSFWDWTGKPIADIIAGSGRDPARAKIAGDTLRRLIHGIVNEPDRIRTAITNSLNDFNNGDAKATLHSAVEAIPFVGPGINQTAEEWASGKPAEAVGHTAALIAPRFLHDTGPAIAEAVGPPLETAGAALKGAASGATEMMPITVRGHTVNVPAIIPAAAAGGVAASATGLPRSLGVAAGAAVPIVKGAAKGARASIVAREAVALAEKAEAARAARAAQIEEMRASIPPPAEAAPPPEPQWSQGPPGLPSGRTPGSGLPAEPPLLQRPQPAWRQIPDEPSPVAQPPVAALPAVLPSGRVPGTGEPVGAGPAAQPAIPPEGPPLVTAAEVANVSSQKFAKMSEADRASAQRTADAVNRDIAAKNRPVPPIPASNPPEQPAIVPQQPQEAAPPVPPPAAPEAASAPPEAPATNTPAISVAPQSGEITRDMTPAQVKAALGLPSDVPQDVFSRKLAEALSAEMQRSGSAGTESPLPSGAPDPTALADLMREVPTGTPKAIAKANYRANQEPAQAAAVYEAAGRATKVSPVVQALIDHGVTYGDMAKLTKKEIQAYVDQLSASTAAEGGQHPGNVFSKLSIDEMMGQLRAAESAAKRAKPPAATEADAQSGLGSRPEVRYVRFGELPKSGRSFNSRDNAQENGVSVHRLVKLDGKWHLDEAGAGFNTLTDSRPVYEVSGREIGVGADGEPLLADAKAVGRYKGPPLRSLPSNVSGRLITTPDQAPQTLSINKENGMVQLRNHPALNEAAGFGSAGGWVTLDQLIKSVSGSSWAGSHPDLAQKLIDKISETAKR